MRSLDRQIRQLDRHLKALQNESVLDLGKLLKKDYKALDKEIKRLYREFEDEGEFDFDAYVVYKELEFNMEVAKRLIATYATVNATTERLLKRSADDVFKGMKDIAGIKRIHKTFDVESTINSNMKGIAWADINNKNRDKVINSIAREVKEGLEKGQSYTQVSERLANELGKELYKMERVVRTESHRVVNKTKLDSMKDISTKVPIRKKWLTAQDERVRGNDPNDRGNHVEMDGVIVGLDEDFVLNDGSRTQAPGQSGVTYHDINCRCSLSIVLPDD